MRLGEKEQKVIEVAKLVAASPETHKPYLCVATILPLIAIAMIPIIEYFA